MEEEQEKSYVVLPQDEQTKPAEKPPVVTPEGYIVKQPRPFRRPPGRPKKGSQPTLSGKELVEKEFAKNRNRLQAIMRREGGFGNLPMPEQLRLTASIYDRQIQHSSLLLVTDSIDEISLQADAMELRRLKVQYVKDLLLIREKLQTLAEKIEDAGAKPAIADVYDEATDLIEKADLKLKPRSGSAADGE
jgi:hypothetical protein